MGGQSSRSMRHGIVRCQGRERILAETSTNVAEKPISAEFVDSTVAIEEAKRNGFKPGGLVTMTLDHSKDRVLKPGRECWTISSEHDFDPAKAVTRGWGVDPKTGKFVMRLSGER